MAGKTTASWLKEAPRHLTRIPKLLAPFTLFAVNVILIPAVGRIYVNPLTADMSRRYTQMEQHTDPSSAEYARLLRETQHDAARLLVISIAVALVTLMLAFAKQIIACFFGGSSSTHSGSGGDRYSLAELLCEVTRWRNIKPSLVTTAVVVAIVAVLHVACMALLGVDSVTAMRESWLLSVRGSLFLAAFLAFFYLGVLSLMLVSLRSKEYSLLVLATLLFPALLIPVCAVAVLYLYTEQVMGLGVFLLSVYDLLQSVQHHLYFAAANVYCYNQAGAREESKEMLVSCNEEKKI